MAIRPLEIKKGDSFLVVCTFTDPSGIPLDLTTVNILSNVRNAKGELISNLSVTKDVQSGATLGKYTLSSETTTWPLGQLSWDIQYTKDGFIQSTETISINVIQDISR